MRMHYDPPPEDEPARDSQCYRVLRVHVVDPGEALSLAANHRWRAAEARRGIPDPIECHRDRCRANWFEGIALEHEGIAAVCERHATRLRAEAEADARARSGER